ncbi:contractile injection system protein, VgrG/Pvc8 family [Pseudoalteromonas sp. SR43-5]|uniref:contractile injection system protein, VgrG/Pvc8 family n=2 Tax=unclassified Pseudoalteromonas TaxID=194690 RepID=UPI002175CE69|nr:contractile injection system protein, VgrG/Pvc8 family [Pseudoalteromonas sp. SR43-5]
MTKSNFFLKVNDKDLNVTYLHGYEKINKGFSYSLTVESSVKINTDILLANASVIFVNKNKRYREQCGLITSVTNMGVFNNLHRFKINIQDRLSTLKNTSNSKVFIAVNVQDVLNYLAQKAGYSSGQIVFRTSSALPHLKQCVQAMESDWAFFNRLMSQHGLFYWIESESSTETLVISDSNLNSPYLSTGVLEVKANAGMNAQYWGNFVGFMHSEVTQTIYNNAAQSNAHGQFQKVASNSQSFFEPAANSDAEVSAQTQSFSNALATHKKRVTLTGNVSDVFAGCSISLDDNMGFASGDLLCIAIEHSLNQANDESSHEGETHYHCVAQFIERGTPYKAMPEPHTPKPMVFPATVESLTSNAFVDEHGQYRIRTEFDKTARPVIQSSPALKKLALYACENQPQATGWHFPLVGGSEVLIGCINNDPNNTFIMGFALNADQPSVVTAANPTHNRLLSAAQNELMFDDDKDAPKVILQTLASEHYIELNAIKSGRQFIQWISQLGTINLHAGRDLCLETEQNNVQFVIKNNQFIDVKNNVSQTTNNSHVNYQSGGSQAFSGKNATLTSENEISLLTGRAVKVNAQSDILLKTNNSDLKLNVPTGSTFLQTNNNINITGSGRGDLIIHNAGGEIKLDSQGNVDITATNVLTLDGTFITFDGPIDFDITSPQTARAPSNASPANISRISDITINDAGIAATTSSVVDLLYVYQDGTPVKNAPYTIKFDDGTQSTGQLDEDGIAQLTDVPNGQFTVQYGEDTREYEPQDNTTPNPLYGKITPQQAVKMIETNNTALLNEANNLAATSGNWLWGALQGDFNRNPSTSQIVVGSVISMIPVIDQLMDCRDICANIMVLSDDDESNDSDGWLALSLTAIGLVPILGSALKGTLKVIIKNMGATLDAAFAVLRKLGKGDPHAFLKNLDWSKLTQDSTKAVKNQISTIKEALESILDSWLIRKMLDNHAIKSIESTLTKLKQFETKVDSGIQQGINRIKGYVDEALLNNAKGRVVRGNTGQPVKAKTAELDASDIELPYKIKDGVKAIGSSPIIFKRHHPHGQQNGDWPDSYTLMPNGRPLGANEGIMPDDFKGLKKLDENSLGKIDEGWPDLRYGDNFENFTDLKADTLPKGTKIYRIIDEGTSEATRQSSGAYWAFELPMSKAQWRENYAVKDSWNDNGHYIEHILEQDEKVWVGGVAGQKYEEFEGKNFYLKGAETQIFIKPGLITGDKIQPKLTNWPDAI